MLLRKRAWDVVREDFAVVGQDETVARAMRAVDTGAGVAVVLDREGGLAGVLTRAGLLGFMERCLLTDELSEDMAEGDFEAAFRHSCRLAASTALAEVAVSEPVTVRPGASLLLVLEEFVSTGAEAAVVADAGKVLGVVLRADLYDELARDVLDGL